MRKKPAEPGKAPQAFFLQRKECCADQTTASISRRRRLMMRFSRREM